jgi:hypothetical protein
MQPVHALVNDVKDAARHEGVTDADTDAETAECRRVDDPVMASEPFADDAGNRGHVFLRMGVALSCIRGSNRDATAPARPPCPHVGASACTAAQQLWRSNFVGEV